MGFIKRLKDRVEEDYNRNISISLESAPKTSEVFTHLDARPPKFNDLLELFFTDDGGDYLGSNLNKQIDFKDISWFKKLGILTNHLTHRDYIALAKGEETTDYEKMLDSTNSLGRSLVKYVENLPTHFQTLRLNAGVAGGLNGFSFGHKKPLTDMSGLNQMPPYKVISISRNDLSELSGLENQVNLAELDISGNNFTDLSSWPSYCRSNPHLIENKLKVDLRNNPVDWSNSNNSRAMYALRRMGIDVKVSTDIDFSHMHNKADSLFDKLHSNFGLPEEVLFSNRWLWDLIENSEKCKVISSKRNYNLATKEGPDLFVKISDDKSTANLESAANFYLGKEFDFIAPGYKPEAIEWDGQYISIQHVIENGIIKRNIDYWVGTLAEFHTKGGEILKDNEVNVGDYQIETLDQLKKRYFLAKEKIGKTILDINWDRVSSAIKYLQDSSKNYFIHGDCKVDNRKGNYLVDLESCGWGNPAIDLALLLVQEGVKEDHWDHYLTKYLVCSGQGCSDDQLKELREAVDHAAIYTSVKELLGSSKRLITPSTYHSNVLLSKYIQQNCT